MIEGSKSGSGSIPLTIADPDPGSPKTCGFGSGFGQVTAQNEFKIQSRQSWKAIPEYELLDELYFPPWSSLGRKHPKVSKGFMT
jgi:hypothetical protein